jgi:hydrogenase maturation protein HypF
MPKPAGHATSHPEDRLLEIRGTVQGVGFRPFVARLAARCKVRGWVRNDARGVSVRVIGPRDTLDAFADALRTELPPAARVFALHIRQAAAVPDLPPAPFTGFVILDSDAESAARTAAVTPDLAMCNDCRHELSATGDRRHAYPFINCTNCGPRYSIIRELPYDRPRTTMAGFAMCPECRREYEDVANRRYHAQPNACPVCGPQVELQDAAGQVLASREAAIAATADALRNGGIVAVKGLGGFHLLVDATNEEAVLNLRRRKHREEKPLAVMFPSLASLQEAAVLEPGDADWLTSAAAPIVLVRRRAGARLAEAVAPGNPWVGALLPYTPLHTLLLEAVGRPVVATSGNLSEEPLCTDNAEARKRLATIADLFLMHNRPIAQPVDDSVVRRSATGPVLLRRARGFAPTPFPLPLGCESAGPLLCVGGHMKNTVAVTAGTNLVVSPHIGDLSNPVSMEAFRRTVDLLGSLYPGRPVRVVCDAHSDYASTQFAQRFGAPVVAVQHHLAHILSCLLEHGGGPERVLGVAWDGTGDGSDGTIWGGEFIVVDRAARVARRVASLRPFRLPGGEAAVREPRRSALGLLHGLFAGEAARLEPLARSLGFRDEEAAMLFSLLDRGLQAPITTSAGRLFDGVAALLGLRLKCSFEGQAAMEVEFAANPESQEEAGLIMPIMGPGSEGILQIDWRPLVAEILEKRVTAQPSLLAARFHNALARCVIEIASRVGIETVALSGGCFQNVRLLDLTVRGLRAAGFNVLCHRDLPPNDGGLCAGQALGALWNITAVSTGSGRPD